MRFSRVTPGLSPKTAWRDGALLLAMPSGGPAFLFGFQKGQKMSFVIAVSTIALITLALLPVVQPVPARLRVKARPDRRV